MLRDGRNELSFRQSHIGLRSNSDDQVLGDFRVGQAEPAYSQLSSIELLTFCRTQFLLLVSHVVPLLDNRTVLEKVLLDDTACAAGVALGWRARTVASSIGCLLVRTLADVMVRLAGQLICIKLDVSADLHFGISCTCTPLEGEVLDPPLSADNQEASAAHQPSTHTHTKRLTPGMLQMVQT